MICDFDDFTQEQNRLDLLLALKDENPLFKATLFAIPMRGTDAFWQSIHAEFGDWLELAVHGWKHGDPASDGGECRAWPKQEMNDVIDFFDRRSPLTAPFVHGFKAPGWQISDGCYQALLERGWWVADQHLEDHRRPRGLPTYFYEDGDDRWHGHIQNVCGNGLEETFDTLLGRVTVSTEFRFVSEATAPW